MRMRSFSEITLMGSTCIFLITNSAGPEKNAQFLERVSSIHGHPEGFKEEKKNRAKKRKLLSEKDPKKSPLTFRKLKLICVHLCSTEN